MNSSKPVHNSAAAAPGEMHLLDHIGELRRCLINIVIAVLIGAIISYYYAYEVFSILCAPFVKSFSENSLIGTGPAEAFMLKLKVAVFCGALLSSPWIFYQIWKFIEPGLYENEKRFGLVFVAASTGCFFAGVFFCYAVVLPFAFDFFYQQYESIGVTPAIRITEQLSMLIKALIGFGVVFEMPVVAFLLGRAGLLQADTLIRGTRYAIVAIFIVAAVLTPPDVLTQLLMAGPLLILYGLSIIIVKYTAREIDSKDTEPSSEK